MKGTTGIKMRQQSAKAMLEAQLLRGTKPEKINKKTTSNMVALTDADRKRIQQEIDNINNKKTKGTFV